MFVVAVPSEQHSPTLLLVDSQPAVWVCRPGPCWACTRVQGQLALGGANLGRKMQGWAKTVSSGGKRCQCVIDAPGAAIKIVSSCLIGSTGIVCVGAFLLVVKLSATVMESLKADIDTFKCHIKLVITILLSIFKTFNNKSNDKSIIIHFYVIC